MRSGATRALAPAIEAPRQELVTARSGRISYYADRAPSGRPLVLVHSINAAPSAFEMKPLFERYRGRRPVYAPDLPGFGLSERSDRVYTPELYATALGEFLASVVGEPADVVALSLGAELAARAALAAPTRFASLAMISPTGLSRREPPGETTSERIRRVLGLPLLGDGLFRLLSSRASIRYFLGLSFEGDPPAEMIDYAWSTAHQPGARYAPFCFLSGALFTPGAFTRLYVRLECPVLVLYDQDPNVSFERLPELLAEHPNWRAERIAPTRGLPHWEAPDRTAEALEAFWPAS